MPENSKPNHNTLATIYSLLVFAGIMYVVICWLPSWRFRFKLLPLYYPFG